MDINHFIENFRTAFGSYELPVAFWYSRTPAAEPIKIKGCFFSGLKPAREGEIVSLDAKTITCPGGKVYSGFTGMPDFLPNFVSVKEHYKETPEQIVNFVNGLEVVRRDDEFINFVTIDKIDSLNNVEGLVFFANPDVISGLISWVFFDNDKPDAVSVPFGSGCSTMVAQTVKENRSNGYRTFLGLFDPSVRPHVEANILLLAIPMSRFKDMYNTFTDSCLQGTHAWMKVKERIENGA